MSGATGARLVAAVGVGCGVVAIWIGAVPGLYLGHASYWSYDHTTGGFMLLVAVLTALLLAGAFATRRRGFDMAAAATGGALFGLFLFIPVFEAFETLRLLGPGAWLGLCTVLTPLALLSLPPDGPVARTPRPQALLGAALAAGGAGCVVAAMWFGSFGPHLGYWDSSVRGLGICLLVVAILTAVLTLAAVGPAPPFVSDAALVLSGVALGFGWYLPVKVAFGDFGVIQAGAWLVFAGVALLVLGVVLVRGSLAAARPRAARAGA